MRLLAYVAQPQPQAKFAAALPYGPSNSKAYDFIPAKLAQTLPTYPPYRENMFLKNMEWWVADGGNGKTNREMVIQAWEAWKLE
jgi:putative spermidine/putrescine transport system substrate-binding protein